MNLRFPYLSEPLVGPPPPSLPRAAKLRWRPLVPISVSGPAGISLTFGRALVDSGADDSIFPLDVAHLLGVSLFSDTGHGMRWRGQRHPLRFGNVELELTDDTGTVHWPATVAFSPANIRYPLLGVGGCLEFFNVRLLGADHRLELEPNDAFARLFGSP